MPDEAQTNITQVHAPGTPVVTNNGTAAMALTEIAICDERIADLRNEIKHIEAHKDSLLMPLSEWMLKLNRENPDIHERKYGAGIIRVKKAPDRIELKAGIDLSLHKGSPYVKEKITYSLIKRDIMKAANQGLDLPTFAEIVAGQIGFSYKLHDDQGVE